MWRWAGKVQGLPPGCQSRCWLGSFPWALSQLDTVVPAPQMNSWRIREPLRVGPLGVDQAHLLAREASPGQPQQRREEPEPCSRPLFCAALGSGNVMEPPSHRWLQLWRDPGAARTASAEGSTPLRVPGHGVGGARCPGMCGWLCAPRQRAPSARLRGWGGYL